MFNMCENFIFDIIFLCVINFHDGNHMGLTEKVDRVILYGHDM